MPGISTGLYLGKLCLLLYLKRNHSKHRCVCVCFCVIVFVNGRLIFYPRGLYYYIFHIPKLAGQYTRH